MRFRIQNYILLSLLVLVPGPGVQAQREKMLNSAQSAAGHREYCSSVAEHNYDVLNYQISVRIDPAQKWLGGAATIRCRALENDLNRLEFDLVDLQVDSVWQNDRKINYQTGTETVALSLNRSFAMGDTIAVTIFYQGHPKKGLYFTSKATYTLTDPIDARRWFPGYDHPSDKATVELRLTVPNGKKIAATGLPVLTQDNTDGTFTQVWQHNYPITTYNIHFASANFATFSHDYQGMPILYFVYPEDLDKARISFGNIPDMMAYMIGLFGPYPFEKYGMDELPLADYLAMEHQTMTSILPVLVTGDLSSDITFAHELSHQWFGNSLSVADWQHMWLNEGFASYFGACYIRYKYGIAAYQGEMSNFRSQFWSEDAQIRYPLANPPWDYIFGRTIYYKGAWVVAMLHELLGDDTFWTVMKTYAAKFAYANVTSADFKALCEQVANRKLDWFFSQWLYRTGYPELSYSSYIKELKDNFYQVDVAMVQTQADSIYQASVEIRVRTSQTDTLAKFRIDEKAENFTIIVPGVPELIAWDPNEKILARSMAKPGFTRPVLVLSQTELDDSDGNHNRVLGHQESANLIVTLKNIGIKRQNIRAQLISLSDEIEIQTGSAIFDDLDVFESGANRAQPFRIRNTGSLSWHPVPMALIVSAESGYLDTLNFDLAIGEPNLMLIDSDAESGTCQSYFKILDSLKIGYGYWDADRYGTPFKLVHPYQTLVWFTGTDSSDFMDSATEDSLSKFLHHGGNLLIAGRHIANRLHERTFFRDYLHAQWLGQTSVFVLTCAANDPICTGDKLALTRRDASQDLLAPTDSGRTAIILSYLGTNKGAALRHHSSYKVVYLGFGLEDVVNDNPRLVSGYLLMQQILSWFAGTVAVPFENSGTSQARDFGLELNYPNPFNQETTISYFIGTGSKEPVQVFVQNLLGQTVKTLVNRPQPAGTYQIRWDGRDQNGIPVGSGSYIVVLKHNHRVETQKMLLVK